MRTTKAWLPKPESKGISTKYLVCSKLKAYSENLIRVLEEMHLPADQEDTQALLIIATALVRVSERHHPRSWAVKLPRFTVATTHPQRRHSQVLVGLEVDTHHRTLLLHLRSPVLIPAITIRRHPSLAPAVHHLSLVHLGQDSLMLVVTVDIPLRRQEALHPHLDHHQDQAFIRLKVRLLGSPVLIHFHQGRLEADMHRTMEEEGGKGL